jgi:hypothetical protein
LGHETALDIAFPSVDFGSVAAAGNQILGVCS